MSTIRTSLERFSRNRVIKRRLPRRFAGRALYVSPDAALSLWKWRLRSDLFDFADQYVRKGDCAWDVGANVGLFTFAAAHQAQAAGQVVAIEPDVFLAHLLNRTAHQGNGNVAPVRVLPVAVADRLSIADFDIAQRGRASNHLAGAPGAQNAGSRQRAMAPTVTLDWLLEHLPAPQVVKIDIESAELLALQGGPRLLREVRPVMLIEVCGETRQHVTDLLHHAEYKLLNWRGDGCNQEVAVATFNTLALPKEFTSGSSDQGNF